ncbi:MAG: S8 family peptidase [Euryarchaeota archaeon]|nr:S8 family peptidase [Euryarchaeota archaeon]
MRGVCLAFLFLVSMLAPGVVSAEPESGHIFVPHVVVGVPDSGINPYHDIYYRPNLTEHPCTYIADFPCDIPSLDLSIGVYTEWEDAVEADRLKWESISAGEWYWIPKTVFVAVHCERPYSSASFQSRMCILDEHGHGTGTTSSILMENPDALIVFKAGGSSITPIETKGVPVDIYSVSWGNIVPVPGHPDVFCANHQRAPIYVTAAGNDPRSTLIDCRKGDPAIISVGGAYAQDRSEETLAAKQVDVVSYFCRPTAAVSSTSDYRSSYCGTSFSAPTVAGALSKVILAIREDSGYTGGLDGDLVDPLADVSINELRDALNRTASYSPEAKYPNRFISAVPLNPVAPWLQWGWGFYDGLVADATVAHMLGTDMAPEKPLGARSHQENVHTARTLSYGPIPAPGVWPFVQDDARSGRDAPDDLTAEVWISSGVVYRGTSTGAFTADDQDHYAFWGEAGDVVNAKVRGTFDRFAIVDENGTILDSAVSFVGWDVLRQTQFSVVLAHSGLYYLHYRALNAEEYAFSIGIDAPAPEPGRFGLPLAPLVPV